MKKLTQTQLKEVLDYSSSTGIFVWLKAMKGTAKGTIAGCINGNGYHQIMVNRTTLLTHRLAWLYVYGYFPEGEIDHINRIRTDNRITNLREVSRRCNLRNVGNIRTNTSGVKGVLLTRYGTWRSYIYIDTKYISLGSFDCFSEAVAHRLAAEQAENWESCDSLSPAYKYMCKFLQEKRNEHD